MSEQQSQQQQQPETQATQVGLNSGRRKLVRAGLAAAPVVAAFKSNMVLATTRSGGGTTVRASAFASFGANSARCSGAPARSTGRYLPLEKCKQDSRCGTLMFGAYKKPYQGCGFGRGLDPNMGGKTLKQVLDQSNPTQAQKLAQYVSAGLLASREFGSDSFITEAKCKEIWNGRGIWSPTAGINWQLSNTLDYFNRVYGVGGFDACLTDQSPTGVDTGDCREPGDHRQHSHYKGR